MRFFCSYGAAAGQSQSAEATWLSFGGGYPDAPHQFSDQSLPLWPIPSDQRPSPVRKWRALQCRPQSNCHQTTKSPKHRCSLGLADPESTTCPACWDMISGCELVYQHTTWDGYWHEHMLRSWLGNRFTCPQYRACVREGSHAIEVHLELLYIDLAYRSPEWNAYWTQRRKRVKSHTTLGISF